MTETKNAPPVLSTPAAHILTEVSDAESAVRCEVLSDEQLETRYEIARTIAEIKRNKWRRIALQFPDEMLPHSARVYQRLARGLQIHVAARQFADHCNGPVVQTEMVKDDYPAIDNLSINDDQPPVKLTILADTSYGSCCVDEVAAEHVDADVIVHYGRACLSPTARFPVIHIYTRRELDHDGAVEAFRSAFPHQATKVVVTADVPFSDHIQPLCSQLADMGYQSIFAASIVHDPSSPIPNRTLPRSVLEDPTSLRDWHLFHISDPPTSLLLTLSSRMASITVHSTSATPNSTSSSAASTSLLLRRRYALITSLASTPIWGILINTLSVRHYLSMITHVQSLISSAGKKSYLFVVGKINAAKVANFAEIGGWVVIGCWESSLIDSKEFYRPIITPFELEMALKGDERVWTGEWRADFAGLLDRKEDQVVNTLGTTEEAEAVSGDNDMASDEESEPPEFDLRTGRYISQPKPAKKTNGPHNDFTTNSTALTKRASGTMISANAISSPAADFLAKQRTWRGLGSDFEVRYDDEEEGIQGAMIEEGQTGVAGGYAVGEAEKS